MVPKSPMKRMKDDPEFNITFVSLVRQYPCLYDNTSLDYSSKAVQRKAWEMIANQINETVRDCKDRWKNLRGCFTRHLKNKADEALGLRHRKPYYLASHLSFLQPFTKSGAGYGDHGDNSQNGDDALVDEEDDDDRREDVELDKVELDMYKADGEDTKNFATCTSTQKVIKRESCEEDFRWPGHKKVKIECGPVTGNDDSDLQFLKSLLPDIREMNGSQKRRFKIGVIQLCEDIINEGNFQT